MSLAALLCLKYGFSEDAMRRHLLSISLPVQLTLITIGIELSESKSNTNKRHDKHKTLANIRYERNNIHLNFLWQLLYYFIYPFFYPSLLGLILHEDIF